MVTARVALLILATNMVSCSAGVLAGSASIDSNRAEPVEECIFAFLYIPVEEREAIPATAIEEACEIPVGDIDRIANQLKAAAE